MTNEYHNFNMNGYVWVRLTVFGRAELEKQHNELKALAPSIGKWVKPSENDEGWSKWQLWDLMSRLGHLIGACKPQPFIASIRFEKVGYKPPTDNDPLVAPVSAGCVQYKEDWEAAPGWANYWAKDENSSAAYYADQPVRNHSGWEPSPACSRWESTFDHQVPTGIDWSRSLRCRKGSAFITEAGL